MSPCNDNKGGQKAVRAPLFRPQHVVRHDHNVAIWERHQLHADMCSFVPAQQVPRASEAVAGWADSRLVLRPVTAEHFFRGSAGMSWLEVITN